MKKMLLVVPLLAGCNALGGLSDRTVDSIANAGGGCVKVTGVWGQGVIIVGSADKGVIRNGELTVAGDCGGVTIRDAAAVRVAPLPPGTVTTISVPASVTTVVSPGK